MNEKPEPIAPPPLPGPELPWHQRRLVIVLCLLCAGPLALPLVWMHRKWKWYSKLYITVAVLGLTWACWILTKVMLGYLQKQMQIIQDLGL